jgi:hypothetical protein
MPVEPMPTGEYRMLAQRQSDEQAQHRGVVSAAEVAEYDQHDEEARTIGDVRLAAMLFGALISAAIAWTAEDLANTEDGHNKWLIFVLVAAVLGAASGEAFGFGLSRWREVVRFHDVVRKRLWFSVLTVLVVAVGLMASTNFLFDKGTLSVRGIMLSGIAIIGGTSTALTLAAIKQVVGHPLPGPAGQQLDSLLRFRRMVSRLLSQLGLLVLLVMAVNAASLGFGVGNQPDRGVVIFSGAVASFVVGTMYVPTASTLRRRAVLFVDRNFSLAKVGKSELIDAADERSKLEKLLGLDQTTFGELKAAFVVLTPVVLSVIASSVKL